MGGVHLRAVALTMFILIGPLATIPAVAQDLNGQWSCIWADLDRGWEFECNMNLIVDPTGQVQGEIHWTMTRSPNPEDKSRIGLSAKEYIRGTMQGPDSITVEGYAKDDPETVIGLDKYKLQVSHSERWLYGNTRAQGNWTGRFFARRP